jgi:hypothetical protein
MQNNMYFRSKTIIRWKKLTHDNATGVNTLMLDQVLVGSHALIQRTREGSFRRHC